MGTCVDRRYKDLTPSEWWIQEIFGGRQCDACGAKPIALLAHVSLPESRIKAEDALGFALGKYGDPVNYKRGLSAEKHYSIGEHAACRDCAKSMELMLAQRTRAGGDYGSGAHVQFDRPPTDKLIVLAS